MNTALPLLALVLSAAAYALGRRQAAGSRPSLLGVVGLLIFVGLGAKYGATKGAVFFPLLGGLLLGSLACVLAEWIGVIGTSVGLGVLASTLMHIFGGGTQTAELGLIVGSMAATVFASGGSNAAIAGVAGSAVVLINALGSFNADVPAEASFGSVLGVLAIAVAIVVLAVRKRKGAWLLGAAVMVGGAVLAAHRIIPDEGLGVTIELGVLTGVVVTYLLPEGQTDPLRQAVATVLWLSLATLAYGPGRGFGVSLALLTGIATPLALGNARAVLSAGPLALLVILRLFQQIDGRTTAALDIGIHYVLLGLAIGVVVPAVAEEWRRRTFRVPALGSLLWCVLFVGIPASIGLVVGGKGLVGYIAGLGFGGLLVSREAALTLRPLAMALGSGAAAIVAYDRLSAVESMTRDEKTRFVAYAAVVIAVVAAPLVLLVKTQPTEEAK